MLSLKARHIYVYRSRIDDINAVGVVILTLTSQDTQDDHYALACLPSPTVVQPLIQEAT